MLRLTILLVAVLLAIVLAATGPVEWTRLRTEHQAFEKACSERGGSPQRFGTSTRCVIELFHPGGKKADR